MFYTELVISLLYVVLGLFAGVLSGIVGIGGGIIIIPALVFLFGFSQHIAQGTTLALLIPPIGILAAWSYFQKGYVNVTAALLICLGFFIGGYFGGKIATMLPDTVLKKVFATLLFIVAIRMFFSK